MRERSHSALSSLLSYQPRLKSEDLGTPQTPAEGWPPSALPLLIITLLADLVSKLEARGR
jgi:hypothetical protein